MFKKSKDRFVEIDVLRGFAVIGMIIYHFFYIGNFYGFFEINFKTLPWLIFARFVQITFLTLVGVSMSISKRRSRKFHSKQFKRAVVVFLFAMGITLVTYIFVPDRVIVFGILHLITVSILVLSVLVDNKFLLLFFATFALFYGLTIDEFSVPHSLILNIIGFSSEGYYALDYFPIFPWISGPLFGALLGGLIYKNGERRFGILPENFIVKGISWFGKNALLIYVSHLVILALFANAVVAILKFL